MGVALNFSTGSNSEWFKYWGVFVSIIDVGAYANSEFADSSNTFMATDMTTVMTTNMTTSMTTDTTTVMTTAMTTNMPASMAEKPQIYLHDIFAPGIHLEVNVYGPLVFSAGIQQSIELTDDNQWDLKEHTQVALKVDIPITFFKK